MDSNDLLALAISVLVESGYKARVVLPSNTVLFEDATLLGGLHIFSAVTDLIESWRDSEMRFLRSQAEGLRSAGEKAWNVYSVFLTGSDANSMQRREVRRIEEDLERTRKLAMYGVTNRQVLIDCVLPLLPLQKKPILQPESYEERLRRRIAGVVSEEAANEVQRGAEPSTLLKILRETP